LSYDRVVLAKDIVITAKDAGQFAVVFDGLIILFLIVALMGALPWK
jgi:hypothetical protein